MEKRQRGGGRDNWENYAYFVSSLSHPCFVVWILSEREITYFTFLLPFLHEQCRFIFWWSNLKTSLRRYRRCNMSTMLAVSWYWDHVFFLFGLKFTFWFSEWSECAGVCYITPGSIKPVKSPLYDFPNVNCWEKEKKKDAFYSQFGFDPTAAIGTISRRGLFTLQRCGQIEEKKCFFSLLDWGLPDLRRAVECSGSDQEPTPLCLAK